MRSRDAHRRRDFRAMGTTVTVLGPDVPAFEHAARRVSGTFTVEEDRFSRFRTTSELCRVNAAAGSWTPISEPFAQLLAFSLDQAGRTRGLFDPTVLRAVHAAGYDRDLDEVIEVARSVLHPPVACGRWREVELRVNRVRLPDGVGLDLGGVAKGWTVDRAAGRTLEAGVPWALVSAGGDLAIVGDAPVLDIDVEEPDEAGDTVGSLRLHEGAIATSSTRRRSWGPGRHHVIDPRTGSPSATGIVQATVWAPTCADAEIASKVALLEGAGSVARRASLLVADDGTVYRSFASFEGRAA